MWGSFVSSELDKVKGKNESQVERHRARTLEALLSRNDPIEKRKAASAKHFADPADLFSKSQETRGVIRG